MTTTRSPRPTERRGGETKTHHNESLSPDAAAGTDRQREARAEPQLAHERDESASSQASATESHKPVGQQAYIDTVGPGTDTDRGPVLDALYNGSLAPRPGDVPPRK